MSDSCCSPNLSNTDAPAAESCCASNLESGASCSAPNLAPAAEAAEPNRCPACGQSGKKTDGLTVKAMLAVSLLHVRDTPYRFCRTPDCDVVYFSATGQTFTTAQIRVPVHQKNPHNPDVPVCYCFQHSPASIRAEWQTTGASTVIEEINGGIQAGQCACEVRNPQGSCCLGNVSQVVKQVEQEMKISI